MTTRKRALTAQIKPDTRNAIMDQLAGIANELMAKEEQIADWRAVAGTYRMERDHLRVGLGVAIAGGEFLLGELHEARRRWWHRFAWWRA